jgi:hypothetical protein
MRMLKNNTTFVKKQHSSHIITAFITITVATPVAAAALAAPLSTAPIADSLATAGLSAASATTAVAPVHVEALWSAVGMLHVHIPLECLAGDCMLIAC